MKTTHEYLAEALREKGMTFAAAQIEYVLNCDHQLTFGKTFNEIGNAKIYLPYMIDTFIHLRSLNKYQSDFNTL